MPTWTIHILSSWCAESGGDIAASKGVSCTAKDGMLFCDMESKTHGAVILLDRRCCRYAWSLIVPHYIANWGDVRATLLCSAVTRVSFVLVARCSLFAREGDPLSL